MRNGLAYFVEDAEALGTDWRQAAACRGMNPSMFFQERGDSVDAAKAKAVCASCPVRQACLEYALVGGEAYGVWGGVSEAKRRRMRGERQGTRRAS